MRTVTALMNVALLSATVALLGAPSGTALAAPAPTWSVETEDILFMLDGRVLHGTILEERATEIVFEFVDRKLNMRAKLTIAKNEIDRIERDKEIVEEAEEATEALPAAKRSAGGATSQPDSKYRALIESSVASDDEGLPGVYVVPMRGQMGTDIHIDIYREVVEDIKAHKPDLVVWVLECADIDELMISMSDRSERGQVDLEQYRKLVNLLKDDMRDIPQMMWVHDSVGISSVVAMAWSDMYMHPDARLAGLSQIYANAAGWSDDDVRAKMIAAWVGIANGFLLNGGYPRELGRAMMNPNHTLAATWQGREVDWTLNGGGEYLVDGSDKRTVAFRAKAAEDFCISQGTASNIDDLMLLKGYREFRIIDGEAPYMVERYVEDWRRAYEQSKERYQDYQQHLGWAGGDETLKWLGRAKRDLEQIISAMDRYKAVEVRWAADFGARRLDLQVLVEQLKEQIRGLQGQQRGGGGGGGGLGR